MSPAGKSEIGCWKIGCIGCGGIVILSAIAILGTFGLAKMQVQDEQVEDQVFTHELSAGDSDREVVTDEGEALTLETADLASRIRLDLAHANFDIQVARPGEPLRVEARYDVGSYELEQIGSDEGDANPDVEIRFRRTGSGWLAGVKEMLGGSKPKVKIYLPTGQPLNLDFELSQGGAEMDLGGLWLTTAEIRFEQGGLDLSFDTPLQAPMERLYIDGSMGGISISRVGNASPRHLEVLCSMGGMMLDLRGPWQNDADIRVDASMGGAGLRLPRDVRIEGLASGRVHVEGETELGVPVLRFETSVSMGELEIIE